MVETKPFRYPEENNSKNLIDKNKGQASNTKRYICKKTRTKTQCLEFEAETDCKGQCSDLEGYIFDIGTRALKKFTRTTKYPESNLGATYINSCQPSIMNETPETFPDPDMLTIITDMGVKFPKMDAEMNYPKNNNIDEDIRQKLRKKDVYETDMHKIYNIIVGQKN